MRRVVVSAGILVAGMVTGVVAVSPVPAFAADDLPPATLNGDVDGSQERDITDAVYLLLHLFAGGEPPVECASTGVRETIVFLASQLTGAHEAAARAEAERAEAEAELSEAMGQLATKEAELAESQQQLADTQSALSGSEADLASTRAQLGATEEELATTQAQLTDTQAELAATEAQLATAESELDTAQQELTDTQIALAESGVQLANTQAALAATEGELTDTQEQLAGTEDLLATTQTELADTQAELAEILAMLAEQPRPGCTDPGAANYDPCADLDDGTCFTTGCTDPDAQNYDPAATVDDGTCYYAGEIPGFTPIGDNDQGYAEYVHDETGLQFVWLPGGTFLMGSPETECERTSTEGPVHEVTLTPFLISKYEVSRLQWRTVVLGDSSSMADDDLPVEVSWSDSKIFLEPMGLRLPTEAQWEYACRAGTETPFWEGSTPTLEMVNFNGYPYCDGPDPGDRLGRLAEVASYPPNGFGLHHMNGNAWEWCEDAWRSTFYSFPEASGVDPLYDDPGCTTCSRVYRGGRHDSGPTYARSAWRSGNCPSCSFGAAIRPVYWPVP